MEHLTITASAEHFTVAVKQRLNARVPNETPNFGSYHAKGTQIIALVTYARQLRLSVVFSVGSIAIARFSTHVQVSTTLACLIFTVNTRLCITTYEITRPVLELEFFVLLASLGILRCRSFSLFTLFGCMLSYHVTEVFSPASLLSQPLLILC